MRRLAISIFIRVVIVALRSAEALSLTETAAMCDLAAALSSNTSLTTGWACVAGVPVTSICNSWVNINCSKNER
jgi:hypothetical protein